MPIWITTLGLIPPILRDNLLHFTTSPWNFLSFQHQHRQGGPMPSDHIGKSLGIDPLDMWFRDEGNH